MLVGPVQENRASLADKLQMVVAFEAAVVARNLCSRSALVERLEMDWVKPAVCWEVGKVMALAQLQGLAPAEDCEDGDWVEVAVCSEVGKVKQAEDCVRD